MSIIASKRIEFPEVNKERRDFLKSIEEKWQKFWEQNRVYEADPDPSRQKFFVTFPYPYINAYPHLGTGYTVLRVDILARFKRMQGYNVLFPQGWHATGGPIVAAALRVREGDPKQINILRSLGIPEEEIPKFRDPEYWVYFFKKEFRRDFQRLGLSIDWRREFFTTRLNPP
ncbi:MAG: class I tRNA ligase family protein, partial [Thermofilum sp.]